MNKHLVATALSVALITLTGCAEESTAQSAPAQQYQAIDVAQVLVKPVQSWHTYTTRLESPQKVALMPRVSGIIEQIEFKEGDAVKQGDVLFRLDDRSFRATVASLQAQVKSAQAALEQAKSEASRAVRLTERMPMSYPPLFRHLPIRVWRFMANSMPLAGCAATAPACRVETWRFT